MIPGRRIVPAAEHLTELFHRAAGGAVDDTRLVPALFQQLEQAGELLSGLADLKIEVGPVKPGGHLHRVAQGEQPHDIPFDLLGGGSGKGPDHRTAGQPAEKFGDVQIARTEILAPLGDAVGFVHDDIGQRQLAHGLEKVPGEQPFRRRIDELVHPTAGPGKDLLLLHRPLGGVDGRRRQPSLLKASDLILHQRDQRRDHQCHPRREQRRKLITHRFARTGGHHAKGVPAGKQRFDKLLLARTEGTVTKVGFQRGERVHCVPSRR